MSVKVKLSIIVVLSAIIVAVIYAISLPQPHPNVVRTAFEAILMTALLSIIIAINFFAVSFFIRRIMRYLRK